MFNSKKLLLTAVVGGLVGMTAISAQATDIDVDATLNTREAVSLTKNTDMDFGTIEYAAVHSGTLQLGSNGTPVLNAPIGLTLDATGSTAGDITINHTAGTVEVTCEVGGTLDDGSANTITLQSVGFDVNTGAAFGAMANTCGGLGVGPVSVDTTALPNPQILIGGELDLNGSVIVAGGPTYSTTTGGDPVTFRVIFP